MIDRLRRGLAPWLVVPLAVAGLAGCAAGPPAPTRPAAPQRLLLIGIDGLEWSVVLPLVRSGRMPHLEKLMQRGSFGRLGTLVPTKSPAIWTTVATGRQPDEHGILNFAWDDPDGRKRLYTSAERRTKALWNIFTDAGKRSCIVSWWNTFPAEEIAGVLVSQANTLEQMARRGVLKPGGLLRGVEGQIYPPSRQDEMLEIVEEVDRKMPEVLQRIFGDIGRASVPADRANLDACAWSVRADESTRRIALRLAAERPLPDLFAVYFGTPDVVAHRFWRYHEPQAFDHPPSDDELRKFGNVITDAYVHADSTVGELVAALPDDTTVVVISDHGIRAHRTSAYFDIARNGKLELESGAHENGPAGVIVASGPGIRPSRYRKPIRQLVQADLNHVGRVLDIAPTLLALVRLPVGRDMDGVVLESILEEGFLNSHPVTYIDTHDTPEWIASRGARRRAEMPGTAERLEQLRSLGYIEDPATEKEKVGSGESDEPIAVFFVRHAETTQSTTGAKGDEDPDPGLSEAGKERARALGRLLSRAEVTHLFASQYRRAQQTLLPLEERTGHEILVIPAQQPEDQLRALRELAGGSIAVVAGHSNTIPGLVCDLDGATPDLNCSESGRSLAHHEYDRLYLVLFPPASATASFAPRTLALRYGD